MANLPQFGLMRSALAELSDGYVLANVDGTVLWANEAAASFYGKDLSSFVGSNIGVPLREGSQKIYGSGTTGEMVAQLDTKWVHIGKQRQFLLCLRDIIDREISREAARQDPLTGIGNRACLEEMLARLLLETSANNQLILCVLDLRDFRQINDLVGRDIGDEVLQECALELMSVTDSRGIAVRFAGDQFAVCEWGLPNASNYVTDFVTKITQAVSGVTVAGRRNVLSVTIGTTTVDNSAATADDAISAADTAIYTAKGLGIRHSHFHTDMTTERARRFNLTRDLPVAIQESELSLHYQPLVDRRHRVVGAEALLRWEHPEYGWVPPIEIVPIAESCGLMEQLGDWIINTVCAQQRDWIDTMPDHQIRVSINVSPRQLVSQNLPKTVRRALARYSLPPDAIALELTESVALSDAEEARHQFLELANLGVDVHIDDFGTGYASLNYLRILPATVVKLDRAFINKVVTSSVDRTIVSAQVDLAHNLGVAVTAEGVETEKHAELLVEMGVDTLQGYYFAKPLAASHFELLLMQAQSEPLVRIPNQRETEAAPRLPELP